MKKAILVILIGLISYSGFSQLGVDFSMSDGKYADTYKQVGLNYQVSKDYTLKAAYGSDNIEGWSVDSVRQVVSAGAGVMLTKQLEGYGMFATAFDRADGNHLDTKFGATLGANYFVLDHLSLGVAYNTIPLGEKKFPLFTVGLKF